MKILFFDIENVFRPEHVFHPGKKSDRGYGRAAGFCSDLAYVLVFGYAWLGEEPQAIYMTKKQIKEDPLSDDHILDQIKQIMDQADVVVTWYGKGHDYPFLVSRLARRGNYLDTDIKHLDLYDVAKKKLRLSSNSMGSAAKFFNVAKKSRISKALWPAVWHGDHNALVEMAEYCKNDVRVLQALFGKMQGLGLPLPNRAIHAGKKKGCPTCGGDRVYGNGYRVTKTRKYHRLRCADCGAHSRGERTESI